MAVNFHVYAVFVTSLFSGTFRASETIDDIKSFIRQNINVQWAVFELKTSLGELLADDNATLLACKLVSN